MGQSLKDGLCTKIQDNRIHNFLIRIKIFMSSLSSPIENQFLSVSKSSGRKGPFSSHPHWGQLNGVMNPSSVMTP